jgi:hypothetical protein
MTTFPPETLLCELATKYGTDKWNWHSYSPVYHSIFKDRRNEVKKVLEIGIGDPSSMSDPTGKPYNPGASHRMWQEYFPNAEIYALDNQSRLLFNEGRIKSFLCDQHEEFSLINVRQHLGDNFDLIVDDGSHRPGDQAMTTKWFVPLLAFDGVYIIEDVWLYPSEVGWDPLPFGLKLEDIPFKTEVIYGQGNNDDRLIRVYP